MLEHVLTALEKATPELRERYLKRIQAVPGDEARQVEQRLVNLVEQDRSHRQAV